MQIRIKNSDAKKRHPKQYADIVAKLRKGKSKHKDENPSKLEWYYNWATQVKAFTFEEVLAGAKDEEPSQHIVWLSAKIGKWWGSSGPVSLEEAIEVTDVIEQNIAAKKAEEDRINSLSEEERRKEVNDCLRELSKYPGFVVCGPVALDMRK